MNLGKVISLKKCFSNLEMCGFHLPEFLFTGEFWKLKLTGLKAVVKAGTSDVSSVDSSCIDLNKFLLPTLDKAIVLVKLVTVELTDRIRFVFHK